MELTTKEILKIHQRRKINIIINIILIVVILFIIYYVYSNLELIKSANQDWCYLCKLKTGANCFIGNISP